MGKITFCTDSSVLLLCGDDGVQLKIINKFESERDMKGILKIIEDPLSQLEITPLQITDNIFVCNRDSI